MVTTPNGPPEAWNEAFTRFTEEHWNAMLRLAISLARSRERAEDITQTALLRGVKYFPNFARNRLGVSSPAELEQLFQTESARRYLRNWLLKIVRNVFLDDAVDLDRWAVDDDSEFLLSRMEAPQDVTASEGPELPAITKGEDTEVLASENLRMLEERFYAEAADDTLRESLAQLNERQRSVLYLIAKDYSYREVAGILGIPIGTVMSSLSRALTKVKGHLGFKKTTGGGRS